MCAIEAAPKRQPRFFWPLRPAGKAGRPCVFGGRRARAQAQAQAQARARAGARAGAQARARARAGAGARTRTRARDAEARAQALGAGAGTGTGAGRGAGAGAGAGAGRGAGARGKGAGAGQRAGARARTRARAQALGAGAGTGTGAGVFKQKPAQKRAARRLFFALQSARAPCQAIRKTKRRGELLRKHAAFRNAIVAQRLYRARVEPFAGDGDRHCGRAGDVFRSEDPAQALFRGQDAGGANTGADTGAGQGAGARARTRAQTRARAQALGAGAGTGTGAGVLSKTGVQKKEPRGGFLCALQSARAPCQAMRKTKRRGELLRKHAAFRNAIVAQRLYRARVEPFAGDGDRHCGRAGDVFRSEDPAQALFRGQDAGGGRNTARRTVAARSGLRSTGGADGMGARRPSDSMAASKQSISAPVSSGVNMNTAQSGSANSHSIRRARRYCASSVPVYPLAFGATVIFSGSSPQSANPLSRRADFSPERRRAAVQPVRISRREIRVCPVERLQDQVGRACGREQAPWPAHFEKTRRARTPKYADRRRR